MLDKSGKHSITKKAGELNNDIKVKPSHALLNFQERALYHFYYYRHLYR